MAIFLVGIDCWTKRADKIHRIGDLEDKPKNKKRGVRILFRTPLIAFWG
jgi:hypothetical protein